MANRSRGAYDLILDSGDLLMGFSLAREQGKPPVVQIQVGPARAEERVANADVSRLVDDLDAGMGYSRRVTRVPNGYSHCLPGYTRAPGGIFCPPGEVVPITLPGSWDTAAIVESHAFMGNLYLVTEGQHVLEMLGGTAAPTVAFGGHTGFTGRGACVFNTRLYVGGVTEMVYRESTGAWQFAAVPRGKLRTVNWRPLGVPTQVMVGTAPDHCVSWVPITADPTAAADWVAPVTVGADMGYDIQEIVAAPLHAYYLRPDGVWDMDELGTRAFNLTPWMEEGRDAENGTWGMHIGAGLYYGHSQGLAYVPTSGDAQYEPTWAQPGWGLPYEAGVRGRPVAGAMHNGWRLVALYDGTQSYIMAGIPSEAAYGRATHVWHGAEAVIPGRVTHMKVHTTSPVAGWPQLLIAATDDAASPTIRLYWQSLTKWGTPIEEMLLGGGFVPADAASLFLPADPWDQPAAYKSLLQVDLTTERLSSTDTLAIYAAADEQTAWSLQGTAEEGPYTSVANLEPTEGRYIRTRIDAVGHPILRSVELRAALGVELRDARVYRVIVGWDNALKTPRGRENRDPEMRMLDLRSMLGRIVTLEDEVPMRVRVLQVLAPERRQLGPANRAGATALVCPILVSVLDQPARYDAAARYDTDRTWS